MSPPPESRFCLEVLADTDPGVLIRLVERIQSLALTPMRLSAQWFLGERVWITFVFIGADEISIETLTRRIAHFPTVHFAVWKREPSPSI